MGVVSDEDPLGRVRQYAILLAALETNASQILKREVRVDVRLYKFQQDFGADLCAGKMDIGRLGARQYLGLRRNQPGLIPLVMPTNSFKQGIFFTRTNSGIQSIADVRGRAMAFGDTNSTISFWAQIKLAEQGIAATNLPRYDFLDSTLDFADEVQNVGHANAVNHIGYLHSHAQVIEGVIDGRYDAGIANLKAFFIKQDQGLVAITNSQFISSRNVLVARPRFETASVNAIVNTMTNLSGYWLQRLPDESLGYEAARPNAHSVEEQWLDRVETLFPLKPQQGEMP